MNIISLIPHVFRSRPWATLLLVLLGAIAEPALLVAENWPQWRGPYGDGFSGEQSVPIVWNAQRGITWQCALPAWGTSSPVVWNRSVFVTSHTDEGKLLLLHIGAQTGRVLWTEQVGTGTTPRSADGRGQTKFHRLHNLATPSPVTNGQVVVVHFGNGDLAAYDYDSGQLWKRNLQDDYGPYTVWWGHANSPVIFQDMVISICLQDSLSDLQATPVSSYIVAHDLQTGKTRWKITRTTDAVAEECDAYTTPLLTTVRGEPRLIVMGGNQLDAYDPRNGKQIWYLPGLRGGRTVTGPTTDGAMVFATRGKTGAMLALPLGQSGALDRRAIRWTYDQGTPDSCTPVAHRTLLFLVSDQGIARCLDTQSGRQHWKQRVPGQYKASPVYFEGRVMLLNTEGTCTIISATRRYSKLVENHLDDQFVASPAIAHGHIYLRGRQALYCIGPSF